MLSGARTMLLTITRYLDEMFLYNWMESYSGGYVWFSARYLYHMIHHGLDGGTRNDPCKPR